MHTVNASEFKAQFGHTLDLLDREPLRIRRRGRSAAILMNESDYADLVRRASRPDSERGQALSRLRELSAKRNLTALQAEANPRGRALLAKHLGDRT